MVGTDSQEKPKIQCNVCHTFPKCFDVCYAKIIYVHSQSSKMSRVCIHWDVHNHFVFSQMCRESLDMVYQCVASDVVNTPTTNNLAIVIFDSKLFMAYYIFKFPFLRGKKLSSWFLGGALWSSPTFLRG